MIPSMDVSPVHCSAGSMGNFHASKPLFQSGLVRSEPECSPNPSCKKGMFVYLCKMTDWRDPVLETRCFPKKWKGLRI